MRSAELAPRSGAARGRRLHERRRASRRREIILIAALVLVVFASGIWALSLPAVRISSVSVVGADASLAASAEEAMRGGYFLGLIPRNSAFFYPARAIRGAILAAHPEAAAVSLARTGFTGLVVRVDARTAVGQWCGTNYPLSASAADASSTALTASSTAALSSAPLPALSPCYVFDPTGFVYAPFAPSSTGALLNPFILYAPLAASTSNPIRATIAQANLLPEVFNFARRLADFNAHVVSIALVGNEADIYLASGTELRYVLGQEENAYAALVSAEADLNLADGSLDYVDLRFPGKIYLKKKGEQ